MNSIDILLQRNLVAFDYELPTDHELNQASTPLLGTLVSNLLYYGYIPSQGLYQVLAEVLKQQPDLVATWWKTLEKALKSITKADKNIGEYIVYKNFPAEVLEMSESDYWTRQLFIYWGVPYDAVQQDERMRSRLFEEVNFKVLQLASLRSLAAIFDNLLNKPAGWVPLELEEIKWFLSQRFKPSNAAFKENLVYLATLCIQEGVQLQLKTATDVLRLATGLSDGDISLNTNTKFKLKRKYRKYILGLLAQVGDLKEGVMRHKNKWKALFHQLHVGEYQERFPKVYAVAFAIRNGQKFDSFNTKIEALLQQKDKAILDVLAQRPGDFARRLTHLIQLFGNDAVQQFIPLITELESITILKLKKHLKTISHRKFRTFPPKSNWRKVQVVDNTISLPKPYIDTLLAAFDAVLKNRVTALFGDQFHYTEAVDQIKLPTNNTEAVSKFNKGTVIDIPRAVKFIRTATYWQEKGRTCWMDNGWNFFDKNWATKGTCCWNNTHEMNPAAVFSGDPVNSYNKSGKAGQLIDLYIPELLKKGIRYGVWSILSYSGIVFSKLEDVQALMMLGTEPQAGKLIEPSRVNLAFAVTGNSLTKYVCYVDLLLRKIIVLDSSLYASVISAKQNEERLLEQLPALVEYLHSLPSMLDLFEIFPNSQTEEAIPVLYSDEDKTIGTEQAYVFEPKNPENQYTQLSIEDFLVSPQSV